MLLVAVSGGIDSMCLAEKVRLEGEPFAIAHCNFGLRGADSDGDEAFVRSWAARYGITCHVKRFETSAYAAQEGISIEMAARRLRYHWFGQICREHGYSGVAVAHNANDNAETLILNLLRGTGIRGITGMKACGFVPDPEFADVPLLRPLLGMTRESIVAFAEENNLQWREDATNALNDYKRNKIRNLVFPVFREINPRFVEVLNRDMDRIEAELNSIGKEQWVDQVQGKSGLGTISGGGPGPGCVAQNSLSGTVGGPGPRDKNVPRPKRGWTRSKEGLDQVQEDVGQVQEDVDQVQEGGFVVSEEPWDGTQPVKQPEGVLILDADKAGEYITGKWEQGDWIKPLGAPGRKKMQDWFTDHHIPADEKPFVQLLKSAKDPHHVLAVIPYCIDNSVRVTSHTKRILRVETND